jgi:hypothetical protein
MQNFTGLNQDGHQNSRGEFKPTDGISRKTFVELQLIAEGKAWFGEKLRFEPMLGEHQGRILMKKNGINNNKQKRKAY